MKRTQNENVNMLACCRNSISCAPENNRSKEFAHCVCVCKKEWRILNCKHITLTHRAAIEMISQMEHNIIWNCYTQKLCCFMVEFPPDSIWLSLSFRVTLHTPPPSPHINLAVIDFDVLHACTFFFCTANNIQSIKASMFLQCVHLHIHHLI